MFKRLFFILICIGLAGFAIYKICGNTIVDAADSANLRAVEEYADAVKLITVDNMMNGSNISYDTINIGTQVKCEKITVNGMNDVELHGCTVENGKTKYKYVNGTAKKE